MKRLSFVVLLMAIAAHTGCCCNRPLFCSNPYTPTTYSPQYYAQATPPAPQYYAQPVQAAQPVYAQTVQPAPQPVAQVAAQPAIQPAVQPMTYPVQPVQYVQPQMCPQNCCQQGYCQQGYCQQGCQPCYQQQYYYQ